MSDKYYIEKKETKGSFDAIFAFLVILAFVFGYSCSNIFNFALEDALDLPFTYSLFMGIEYSQSMSYAILSMVSLFILSFLKQRLLIRNKDNIDLKRINTIFKILLITSCITAFFFLVRITYSYLNGSSEIHKIYHFLITIFMLSVVCAYAYFETYISIKITQGKYMSYMILLSLCLFTPCAVIVFNNANPKEMALFREDLNTSSRMRSFLEATKRYLEAKKHLPQTMGEIIDSIAIKEANLKKYDGIEYIKTGSDNFEICANFTTNARKFKRIASDSFTLGKNCKKYLVKIEVEGNKESISIHIKDK